MIICNGNKINDLVYDVIQHWIHLKEPQLSRRSDSVYDKNKTPVLTENEKAKRRNHNDFKFRLLP